MSSLHHTDKYDDIINLPHPVSKTHPPMDIMDRAAQFSPFAALTGYEAAAEEAGRLTQPKIELDESEKALLDIRLHDLEAQLFLHPMAVITCFIPDARKEGGAYCTLTGKITKIDHTRKSLTLETGESIPIENIYDIQPGEQMDKNGNL